MRRWGSWCAVATLAAMGDQDAEEEEKGNKKTDGKHNLCEKTQRQWGWGAPTRERRRRSRHFNRSKGRASQLAGGADRCGGSGRTRHTSQRANGVVWLVMVVFVHGVEDS
jgi:hypothetical protein